jgi:hypothetical protein
MPSSNNDRNRQQGETPMAVYNEYRVTLQTRFGSIQVTVSAMSSSDAARAAEGLYPGSRAQRIELVR